MDSNDLNQQEDALGISGITSIATMDEIGEISEQQKLQDFLLEISAV
jgi:hypothetical protein